MNDQEIWKDIPGYGGYYQVSNKGRVKSLDRWVNTKWGTSFLRKGKILKLVTLANGGYQIVLLSKYGRVKTCKVHHLVLETFIKSRPKGLMCRHLDGNPANNKPENLKWGTCKQNSQDRDKHDRTQKGSKHVRSIFTESDISIIRDLRKEGKTEKEIAELFNASRSAIAHIIHKRCWKHIK